MLPRNFWMIKYQIRKIGYDTYAVYKKFLFWWIRDNGITPRYNTEELIDYIENKKNAKI